MAMRTKKKREEALLWIETNAEMILSTFQEGSSINWIRMIAPVQLTRDDLEKFLSARGCELRGLSQNGKTKQLLMARETSLKKFGYENASSSPAIKQKREETFMKRLGVKNPFQDEGIKRRITAGHIKKYGVPNPGIHSPKRVKISRPHATLSAALHESAIEHQNEVPVYRPDVFSKMKAPRVDIMIGNLVVEVFGDYFHANPMKYRQSDQIKLFKGRSTAPEIWYRDAERLKKLELCGYRTLVVWEYDIKKNLPEVIRRIQHELAHH